MSHKRDGRKHGNKKNFQPWMLLKLLLPGAEVEPSLVKTLLYGMWSLSVEIIAWDPFGFISVFPEGSKWILSDFCCHHEQTVCSENVRLLTSSPSSIRCQCKPYTNFRKCSRTWWCRVSFCSWIYPREEDFNREEFDASVALQVWPGGTSSPRISSDGSWATSPPSAPLSNHMKKWLIG